MERKKRKKTSGKLGLQDLFYSKISPPSQLLPKAGSDMPTARTIWLFESALSNGL